MQKTSLTNRKKIFPNQNLGSILAIGFGGSVLLHLGLIAGISHWCKPPAVIDEPLEITLVEPIANEETSPAPVPTKLPPKQVSIPKPIALKPIPIPTIPQSIPLPIKPTPIVIKPQLKPIAIKPKPIPPKLTPTPISKPIPPAIVNPPFPGDKFIPIDTPSFNPPTNSRQPTQKFSIPPVKTALAEPPTDKIAPSTFNLPPIISTTPSNLSPPLTQTATDPSPQDLPKVGEKPLAGGNNSDRLSQPDRGNNQSTGGILAGNGDRSNGASSNRNQQGNSTPKQSSDPPVKANSNSPAITSNSNSGTGGRLQCVQNCQIAKLQDLQDGDGGKDRLRIRIVVDVNGVLLSAEIAKSSGNLQIDSVVLDGVKQMSFNPTGKIIKAIIKANILF
jgi:TonB family protein